MGKSDFYQYKFVEILFEPLILNQIRDAANRETCADDDDEITEKLEDLRDKLIERLKVLISECLTPHQKTIASYTMDGYSQTDIAKIVGNNQSAVHKGLYGNVDYINSKKYGGIAKKLRRIAANDQEVIKIINHMNLIKNRDISLKYCYACHYMLNPICFVQDRSRRDGKNNKCRPCAHAYLREYNRKKKRINKYKKKLKLRSMLKPFKANPAGN